jgi:hypothetical protein
MVLKLKDAPKVLPFLQNLMEEESIIVDVLISFASNIRKEICVVLEFFLSLLRKFEKKKTHNMLSLMLDLRFKSFCFVSSFIGREQGVSIVEEYDSKSLYLMLLKCHHHLHPLA